MKTNRWIAWSQRFYLWLLRLYPQAYRATYEMEMFRLFTDQCREAYKQRGGRGVLALWPRTLVDVGITVTREHLADPQATLGLLEAKPDAPLPWKGVLLVSIPGLIFFISQVEQVISNNDWFFIAFYRAGYVLILPVLLTWLSTRRFPIWGLIPLGLLYETLWTYGQRVQVGDLFFAANSLKWGDELPVYAKYLSIVVPCAILLLALIWHSARRGQISRNAWTWLGLYGLLVVLRIVVEISRVLPWQSESWPSAESAAYLFQVPVWNLYDSLPFLMLIFTGMFFARKYGGFSFLLLLGYLLPTVVFGRYGIWNEYVPFIVVSLAVLIYRFVVALVAPVWLVRAASIPGRQRAAALPVAAAILCHISLNLIYSLAWASQSMYTITLLDLAMNVWGQLLIAAGLGLAVALYLPRIPDQAPVSPPDLAAAT